MNILALSGSLRQHSLNRYLLEQAAGYFPTTASVDIAHLDLPLYNEDLESDLPVVVNEFKQRIAAADGLLIASPEFNHSIPGVLQNALDWASRPAFNSPLKGKPVAILSASPSPVGGARMQAQLKPVLVSTLAVIYPAVEFILGGAHNAFDEQGALIDDTAKRRLQRFIEGYCVWLNQQLANH